MLHKLTQQMKLYNSTQAHTITPGTSAHHWMKEAIDRQASDLFLSTAEPPTLKVYNEFITLKDTPLSAQEILQIITEILPEKKLAEFHSGVDIDLGVDAEGLSRFRINVFRELHGDSLTLRPLPYRIPALNELGLPQVLTKLSHLNSGLILVTGPTGCGKSTTLAAMIEAVNQRAQKHIITIEDPIEYIIPSKRAIIHQREIGTHVASFADGLRSALRENPDIIVVGELRDLESISLAVTAAETGHLVLGTLHSGNAVQAITRLTDAFDSERQPQIRIQLSQSLQAVISQRLFKRRDKPGMAVATEVMIATLAMRTLIRENRIQEMHGYISTGAHEQMHTLEQSVEKMVNEGILDRQCLDELSENVIHAITDPQTNDGKTERGRYAPHKD
jgi:twitching motility protein PilT